MIILRRLGLRAIVLLVLVSPTPVLGQTFCVGVNPCGGAGSFATLYGYAPIG